MNGHRGSVRGAFFGGDAAISSRSDRGTFAFCSFSTLFVFGCKFFGLATLLLATGVKSELLDRCIQGYGNCNAGAVF